jgi:acetyltransferase
MYVESFKDAIAFLDTAAEVARHKPVVVCKGGRTAIGQRAARSHTGGLAGEYAVAKACLRDAGAVVVERSDAILPIAECLSVSAPMRGRRVAVLADGGGHATLAADALAASGLVIPELEAGTRERLRAVLSPHAVVANPVDVANTADAGPGVLAEAADILLSDASVDALLVVGMFGGFALRFSATLAEAEAAAGDRFATLPAAHRKPIILHSIFAPLWPEPLRRVRQGGIPLSGSIEMAALAMGALADYSDWLRRPRSVASSHLAAKTPERAQRIVSAARADGRTALLEPEALDLLDAHGIATRPRTVVRNASEARAAAGRFAPMPLALKVVSPDILHKSAFGGVRLGVRGVDEMEDAHEALLSAVRQRAPDADVRGVLVTPMAEAGVELIVGVTRDPQFGPVMMVGLGGTLVESLRDVAFGRLPVDRIHALAMIGDLRAQEALDGLHGARPVDRERLAALMTAVSELCLLHPEIVELDLNPVITSPGGCAILDARVLLAAAGDPARRN